MKFKHFSKAISFVLLFCFSLNSFGWSDLSNIPPISPEQSFLKQISLPSHLGRVEEIFIPSNFQKDSPFIIYLQDAHANLGAQKNIAQIARLLGKQLNVQAIFAEGGSREIDFSKLRSFSDQKVKEDVTQFWMKEAVLNGIERETIIGDRPYQFYGIEDQASYELGGKYFVETTTDSKPFIESVMNLLKNNFEQRKRHDNPALFQFEELATRLEQKQDLKGLVSLLANEARNLHINRWKYLEIEKFINLILIEL